MNQAFIFVLFILNGIFIGILFDFFRILRRIFKTKNIIIYIEDILFWILSGISIIFCMYNFTDGSLRLFMVIGLIVGITIYLISFSKIFIKISIIVINILKKIISFCLFPITFFLKTLLKAINFLYIKMPLKKTKFIIKDKVKAQNTKKH